MGITEPHNVEQICVNYSHLTQKFRASLIKIKQG